MSRLAKRYYATDETFREVADLLFGGGGDELVKSLVSKAEPSQSDVSSPGSKAAERKKFERRQAQVGLASNAVGIAAGAAGLKEAASHYKKLRKIPTGETFHPEPIKIGRGTKALAAGAVGLQAANLVGDAVANRVLARGAKKKDSVNKADKGSKQPLINIPNQATMPSKGKLTRAAVGRAADSKFITEKKAKLKMLPSKVKATNDVEKRAPEEGFEVTWRGEISKVDNDKRQVFGWASIVEMNGEPVVDLQGDYISIDEIEKSAYDYVQKSRKGGDMHRRNGADPHHVSDMIESFIVTPEKKERLGLPDEMPVGWWVGYQVHDDDTWNLVKSGARTGFSIHGRGTRKSLEG